MVQSVTKRTIAVRPPEYFPNLSYVALLASVDLFVLADTFRYSHKSLQNRAKLRTPQGWQWVSVPLRGTQHGRPVREVEIDNRRRWSRSHWRSFMYNYRSTMYFEFFEDDFRPIFEQSWDRLGALSCTSVELTARLLELDAEHVRASELDGAPDTVPAVLEALGANEAELWAPPAAAVHDAKLVSNAKAFHYEAPTYRQNFEGFEPEMSATDLLFNYGPEARPLLQEGAQVEPVAEEA